MQEGLAIFRKDRRRCLLLDMDAVYRDPQGTAALLGHARPPETHQAEQAPAADALRAVLLRALIAESHGGRSLLDEIDISHSSPDKAGWPAWAGTAMQEYAELRTQANRCEAMARDAASLRRDIIELTAAADHGAAAAAQLALAQHRVTDLERRLGEAAQAEKRLREQRNAVEIERDRLCEERNKAYADRTAVEAEIKRIYGSYSIRMTEPIRQMRRLLSRGRRRDG